MNTDVTRKGVVVVIDDDVSVRTALKELFESVGLEVKSYASGRAFLEDGIPDDYELLGARCEAARNEWFQISRGTGESSKFTCRSFSLPAMETSRWPCARSKLEQSTF